MAKLRVEVTIVTSLDAVAAVDILAVNSNDVNRVKTRTVHFAWPLNRRLGLIEQTKSTTITQILSLVRPLKIAFFPIRAKATRESVSTLALSITSDIPENNFYSLKN